MMIRPETEADLPEVYELNVSAFESDAEAKLVDALRSNVTNKISLVAEIQGKVVGHIMFTPVSLEGHSSALIMGLAPMAVNESFRSQGIGSSLVKAGVEACADIETGALVVLGHPDYYPRFGFRPASEFGLTSEYDVPDEVFMAMQILPGYLDDKSGLVRYHSIFGGF